MVSGTPYRKGWVGEPLASLPPCPPFPEFTAFEKAALNALAALFGIEAGKFLAQVNASRVVDRINTIHGFYTRVLADRSLCQRLPLSGKGGSFEVESIEHGIGVLLWEKDGYLETIEGYSYGGDALLGLSLADLRFMGTEQPG